MVDSAGPSIWHRFAHVPRKIAGGNTNNVACNHYRRWREDVEWMRRLGLTAYRFSLSWSRILPEGTGRVNQRGLDFYRRLIDALLAAGIEPFVTLYHWDLPAALDDRGGWLSRDVAGWFADYAAVCYRALDDRVRWWATLNEPWVVADGGYLDGVLAPGRESAAEAVRAAHHLLLAHAAGVEAYRAVGRHQIGLVLNFEPKHPASDRPEDLAAAARADAYMNRHYADPVFLGRYPDELAEIYGEAWTAPSAVDLERIRVPIDFLGINYYTRSVVRHDPAEPWLRAARVLQPESVYTATDWEVYPAGLAEILRWVRDRYGAVPLYVTENGAAFDDPPAAVGGRVDDPQRVAYLADHLRALAAVRTDGADVRGYFVWSLLDNFEWAYGFAKRFGLLHVDYATLARTPKASALFYADVIRSRGAVLSGPEASTTLFAGGGAPLFL